MANGGNRLTTYPSTAHWYKGEKATPTDPGNTQKRTQNHIIGVEYASHMMVPSASKAENGCNPRE
jgi:hypothetical protein